MCLSCDADRREEEEKDGREAVHLLNLVELAVQQEIDNGFGNYMQNIQRALQGKAPKQKQRNTKK